MGFKVDVFVCDQVVKQYVMCEKIIACMNSLAASVVRYGRMCLKLFKLNLIVFVTFFTCFLKVKFESSVIPRYLNSDTT